MDRLLQVLQEIKDIVDRLRELESQRQLCEEILRKIAEIEDILNDDDVDELEAFRLLIILLELLSGLGSKVPLLGTFLELYLAAMNSALFVIEASIVSHGHLNQTCLIYCGIRAEREERSRENGATDEGEIARDGHFSAMISVGFSTYDKHQNKFRAQYEDYKRKLELQQLLAKAGELMGGQTEGPEDSGGEVEPPDDGDERRREWERLFARFSAWLEFGEQAARRAREIRDRLRNEDLSDAERRRLETELARLESILSGVFGP